MVLFFDDGMRWVDGWGLGMVLGLGTALGNGIRKWEMEILGTGVRYGQDQAFRPGGRLQALIYMHAYRHGIGDMDMDMVHDIWI
jgi:hypothetical protein